MDGFAFEKGYSEMFRYGDIIKVRAVGKLLCSVVHLKDDGVLSRP